MFLTNQIAQLRVLDFTYTTSRAVASIVAKYLGSLDAYAAHARSEHNTYWPRNYQS